MEHLLYCLFITWENIFLEISQSRHKLKLLVIEKSYSNVANFLKRYFGEFFDITSFNELGELKIDQTYLAQEYHVIVTDIILDQQEDSEVLFFSQMIPSVIAHKLNAFLRVRINEEKQFSHLKV